MRGIIWLCVGAFFNIGLAAQTTVMEYSDGPYPWGIDGRRECHFALSLDAPRRADGVVFVKPGGRAGFALKGRVVGYSGAMLEDRHYWRMEYRLAGLNPPEEGGIDLPRNIWPEPEAQDFSQGLSAAPGYAFITVWRERRRYNYARLDWDVDYPEESLRELVYKIEADGQGPQLSTDLASAIRENFISATISASDLGVGLGPGGLSVRLDGGEWVSGQGPEVKLEAKGLAAGWHTIEAKAQDLLGNQGEKSFSFLVDTQAPSLSGLSPKPYYATVYPSFEFKASDDSSGIDQAGFRCELDGQGYKPRYDGETGILRLDTLGQSAGLSQGAHTLVAYARDVAGNAKQLRLDFSVDSLPPVIGFDPNPGVWTRDDLSLSLSVSDDGSPLASLEYKLEAGDGSGLPAVWTAYRKSLNFSAGEEINHSPRLLRVMAKDKAGNQSIADYKVALIDRRGPSFSLEFDGRAVLEGDSRRRLRLRIVSCQDYGIGPSFSSWRFSLGDGDWAPASVAGDVVIVDLPQGLAEGRHRVGICLDDKLGNPGNLVEYDFELDLSPPRLDLRAGLSPSADSAAWFCPGRLSLCALDQADLAEYSARLWRLAGGTVREPCLPEPRFETAGRRSQLYAEAREDGLYLLELGVVDHFGNKSSVSSYLRVDGSPPTLTQGDGGGAVESQEARASDDGCGLDEASWRWRVNGAAWANGHTALLPEGAAVRVEFEVADILGNRARSAKVILVDRSPPLLDFSLAKYQGPQGIRLLKILAMDALSLPGRLEYRLDDGQAQELDWPLSESLTIERPAPMADGLHSLGLRACDALGNTSAWRSASFTVDTVAPQVELLGLTWVKEGVERSVKPGDCLGHGRLSISMNQDLLGPEDAYYYYLSPCALGSAEIAVAYPTWARGRGPGLELELGVDGAFRLYLVACDPAGNLSDPAALDLWVDGIRPGQARISCLSHPESGDLLRAASPTRADFLFWAGTAGPSGLGDLEWRLYRGLAKVPKADMEELARGSLDIAGGRASLSLEGLGESREGEIYLLEAWVRSASLSAGPSSQWGFRVDSQAPEGLRLGFLPEAGEGQWISRSSLECAWQRPRDLSGIRGYDYRVSVPGATDSQWLPIQGQSLSLASGQLQASAEPFERILELRAGDGAGNYAYDSRSLRFDCREPGFDRDSGLILGALESGSRLLSWPRAHDVESGISAYELRVVELAEPGRIRVLRLKPDELGPDQDQCHYLLMGLSPDADYSLALMAVDGAENRSTELRCLARCGTEAADYEEYYQERLGQYGLSGFRLCSGQDGSVLGLRGLSLHVPQYIPLSRPDGGTWANFPNLGLEKPLLDGPSLGLRGARVREGAGDEVGAAGEAWAYEIPGIRLILQGLGFTRTGGLGAELGRFTLDCYSLGGLRKKSFFLPKLSLGLYLGSPPESTWGQADDARDFDLSLDAKGQPALTGLRLRGLSELALRGDSLLFRGKDAWVECVHAGILSYPGRADRARAPILKELRVPTLSLAEDDTIPALMGGDIDCQGLVLSGSGLEYEIIEASLEGDRLIVSEARARSGGLAGYDLIIKGFGLDLRDGRFSPEPWFSVLARGELCASDGLALRSARFILGPDGSLGLSAEVELGRLGWLGAEGLLVQSTGISMAKARLDIGGIMVQGFPFFPDAGGVRGGLLVFDSGRLHFHGVQASIGGLAIDWRDASLSHPGTLLGGGFEFPCAYGTLKAESLRLDASGLWMSGSLKTPAANFASCPSLRFQGLGLLSSGGFIQTRTLVNSAGGALPACGLGGYTLRGAALAFDGSRISVEGACLSPDKAWGQALIELVGPSFTERGLSEAALAKSPLTLTRSGFCIYLAQASLDEDGLGGPALCRTGEKTPLRDLSFPKFRLRPANHLESGQAAADFRFCQGAWEYGAARARLSLDEAGSLALDFEAADISRELLQDGEGRRVGTLTFSGASRPKARLGPEGQVIRAQAADWLNLPALRDGQGLLLSPSGILIGAEGPLFSGRLSCPNWEKGPVLNLERSGFSFSDGIALRCSAPEASVDYGYRGYALRGQGFSLGPSGIKIASSSFTRRGVELPIGGLVFNPEGRLASSSRLALNEGQAPIDPCFSPSHSHFGPNGYALQGIFTFPEFLGPHSIAVDALRIAADGGIFVEDHVESIQLELGGLELECQDLSFGIGYIRVGWAQLTLPAAAGGERVAIRGLRAEFGPGRPVKLSLGRMDGFKLCGLGVEVRGLEYDKGCLSFAARLRLEPGPGDSWGPIEFEVREFSYCSSGRLKVELAYAGDLNIILGQSASLRLSELYVSLDSGMPSWRPRLGAKCAALSLELDGWNQCLELEGLCYDIVAHRLEWGSVALRPGSAHCCGGLELSLSELSYSSSGVFSLSGTASFPAETKVPEFLTGARFMITRMEIGPDASLLAYDLSLDGLQGQVVPGLDILAGQARLHGQSGNQGEAQSELSLSGGLVFGPGYPSGLAGTSCTIGDLRVDCRSGRILAFSFLVEGRGFDYCGIGFRDAGLALAWDPDAEKAYINVKARVLLPKDLPGLLGQSELLVDNLRIDSQGRVLEAELGMGLPGRNALCPGIDIVDAALRLRLGQAGVSLDISGTLSLTQAFPEGLAGLSCRLSSLCFDGGGRLTALDASILVPDGRSILGLRSQGLCLGLSLDALGQPLCGIRGQLCFPPSYPPGLAGKSIGIKVLTLDGRGRILALEGGLEGIDARFFEGMVGLSSGRLSLGLGPGRNELVLSLGGDIRLLSPSLPRELREASFEARRLSLSTTRGLLDLDIGLKGQLRYETLPGLRATLSGLRVSNQGISLSGSLELPSRLPEGLASQALVLEDLSLSWDGRLIRLVGGMGSLDMELAGFKARAKALFLDLSDSGSLARLCLDHAEVFLPKSFGSLGGQGLGLAEASLDLHSWELSASFYLASLESQLAGFTLHLDKPELDFKNRRLGFGLACLKMPALLGGSSLELKGLVASPAGLSLAGGGFSAPDFCLPGGLAFSGLRLGFVALAEPVDGESFSIEGAGRVNMPNVGSMEAKLAFTNRRPQYPLGLKRAYFSFEAERFGLPLGSSGLYIKGARGGLFYGPCDDVPEAMRDLFADDGVRIQLGLSVVDACSGGIVKAKADAWIDVRYWDFALRGELVFLDGYFGINAAFEAALTRAGLYASAEASICVLRGRLEIFLFNKEGGASGYAAQGKLDIGLPKGSILPKPALPWADCWLSGAQVEFGDFTKDGKPIRGFKAYADIPILGQTGLFCGRPGAYQCGSVGEYVLNRPSRSAIMGPNAKAVAYPLSSGDVPALGQNLDWLEWEYDQSIEEQDCALLGIESGGLPLDVYVRDPGGAIYRLDSEGDPRVAEGMWLFTQDDGAYLRLDSPARGTWGFALGPLASGKSTLRLFAKGRAPRVMLDAPLPCQAGLARLSGRLGPILGRGSVRIGLSQRRDCALGPREYEAKVGADGAFSLSIPLEDCQEGEYWPYAYWQGGEGEFGPTYLSPQSLRVEASGQGLQPPRDIELYVDGAGDLTCRWRGAKSSGQAGYYIEWLVEDGSPSRGMDIGYLCSACLGPLAPGMGAKARLRSYDGRGVCSEYSPWLSLKPIEGAGVKGGDAVLGFELSPPGTLELSPGHYVEFECAYAPGHQRDRDIELYLAPQAPDSPFTAWALSPLVLPAKGPPGVWRMALAASAKVMAGEYSVSLRLSAPALAEAKIELALRVRSEPAYVDGLYPSDIPIGARRIDVLGWGLGDLEWVGLDGLGVQGYEASQGQLGLNLAEGLGPGRHALSIRCASGQEIEYCFDVAGPRPGLRLLGQVPDLYPGDSVLVPLRLENPSLLRYPVRVEIEGSLEGLECPEPGLAYTPTPEGDVSVQLGVGTQCPEGDRSLRLMLRDAEGAELGRLILPIRILTGKPQPRVFSCLPKRPFPGQELRVLGLGLGSEGRIFVNEMEITPLEWGPCCIRFRLPQGIVAAHIRFELVGGGAIERQLSLNQPRFELASIAPVLSLRAGEALSLGFGIGGWAPGYTISFEGDECLGLGPPIVRREPLATGPGEEIRESIVLRPRLEAAGTSHRVAIVVESCGQSIRRELDVQVLEPGAEDAGQR